MRALKIKKIKFFNVINVFVMIALILCFALPYGMILGSSLSTERSLAFNGYLIFPREFSFAAYKYIFSNDNYMFRSILNSVFLTGVGTLIALIITPMYAYVTSRSRCPGKRFLNNFAIFTMLFGGGLIPYYLLVTNLGLRNTLWAIILPGAMSAWNMLLVRNYFYGIPDSLEESAKLDGANSYAILFRIYMPMSMPVLASIFLFSAVGYWNNWFGPLLFIETKAKYPVQYLIKDMLSQLESLNTAEGGAAGSPGATPLISTRMAAIVVASLPVIAIYPFLQKYFINGVMLGSVKE